FRHLPVRDPGQLVFLSSQQKTGGESAVFSYPNFQDIQDQTTSVFSGISQVEETQSDGISIDGRNEPIITSYVSGNFFSMLGIEPAMGRLILPSEGKVAVGEPIAAL